MTKKDPISTRADYMDFYPLQTRWIDNDIYGHMNNVVHYSLFDTAVNGWLMERDLLDPKTLKATRSWSKPAAPTMQK